MSLESLMAVGFERFERSAAIERLERLEQSPLAFERTGGNAILAEYLDRVAYELGQKESKKRQQDNWRQSKDASKF